MMTMALDSAALIPDALTRSQAVQDEVLSTFNVSNAIMTPLTRVIDRAALTPSITVSS